MIAACQRAHAVERQIAGRHAAEQAGKGNPARQLMTGDQDCGADNGDIFMHERRKEQAACPGSQPRIHDQAPFKKLGYVHIRPTLRAMIRSAYPQAG